MAEITRLEVDVAPYCNCKLNQKQWWENERRWNWRCYWVWHEMSAGSPVASHLQVYRFKCCTCCKCVESACSTPLWISSRWASYLSPSKKVDLSKLACLAHSMYPVIDWYSPLSAGRYDKKFGLIWQIMVFFKILVVSWNITFVCVCVRVCVQVNPYHENKLLHQ